MEKKIQTRQNLLNQKPTNKKGKKEKKRNFFAIDDIKKNKVLTVGCDACFSQHQEMKLAHTTKNNKFVKSVVLIGKDSLMYDVFNESSFLKPLDRQWF